MQNHVDVEDHHPRGDDPKYYDVIDELWLSDAADFAVLAPGAAGAHGAVAEVEAELLAPGRTLAHVAEFVASIP